MEKSVWKSFFYVYFRNLTGKFFAFPAKTLRQVCQKGLLRVLGNVLRLFSRKKKDSFFYRSQTFSNNKLDFWRRTFSSVAEIEFYISKGTFCAISSEKTLNNFYSFQTVSKKHSHFPQKFPAGSTKLPSTTPRDCFEILFWEIYMRSSSFWHYEKKNKSSFDGKPSIGLSNCSDSRGTFCGKNVFFWENYNYFFRLPEFKRMCFLSEVCWQVCQKCILGVQGNIFRQPFFRSLSRKLSDFRQMFPVLQRNILSIGLKELHFFSSLIRIKNPVLADNLPQVCRKGDLGV